MTGTSANAQANANAVTGANDAFGYRNGDEAIGIYDESSVRGFNLEAAGNYRMDGTYFVKNSGVSSFFLESTTVRIGSSTLNTILPGPSGVIDFRLRDPVRGEPSALTIGLDYNGQPYAELLMKHRSADDKFSYSAGVGRVFDARDPQGGGGGESFLLAGTARITQGAATARVFVGEYQYERAGKFRVVANENGLPPAIARHRYLGQRWMREEGQRRIAGVLADVAVSRDAGIGATAVFSQEDPTQSFTQIFRNVMPDGMAHASVIAVPQQRSTAWSGEVRAHVQRSDGELAQRIDLSLRGRRQRARNGGGRSIDLGEVAFGERPVAVDAPFLDDAIANLRDRVDQWGIGITYRATLAERLRVNAGMLRTDYQRLFIGADGVRQGNRDTKLLYNMGLEVSITPQLDIYASYSRGLEDAGVAPAVASNRNQVLNAIEVTQREIGIRARIVGMTMVVAGFDTRKPYAGIDATNGAYRFLGEVRHRGVEASFSARPLPGLFLIAGGVLIDPRLSGAQVEAGRIGQRPVGVPKVRAIANMNYDIGIFPGLAVDAGLIFAGDRAAQSRLPMSTGRQLRVKATTTVNAGLRYRFNANANSPVVRLQIRNLFDQQSWDVNNSETLDYTPSRSARFVITIPF